jgi:hypothetical protein
VFRINSLHFNIEFVWQRKLHSGVIRVRDVLTAILATIHIDHLRGARFGFCHRHDCRKPFEIISKHKRKYCSQYCAPLSSMRKRQRRKRRETGQEE